MTDVPLEESLSAYVERVASSGDVGQVEAAAEMWVKWWNEHEKALDDATRAQVYGVCALHSVPLTRHALADPVVRALEIVTACPVCGKGRRERENF